MKKLNKKLLVLVTAIALSTSIVGCGSITKNKANKSEETVATTPKGQDDKLTKKIKKLDIVADGSVYPDGDYMCGTMVIKDNATQQEIEKAANEYADKIKAKYKDKKVSVQAVQKGKCVANITRK